MVCTFIKIVRPFKVLQLQLVRLYKNRSTVQGITITITRYYIQSITITITISVHYIKIVRPFKVLQLQLQGITFKVLQLQLVRLYKNRSTVQGCPNVIG
jgi:hypothetical protein